MWVVGMILVAAEVVQRRRAQITGLRKWALAALALSTGVALGVLFGLGVFDDEPVAIVVIAGITIGNVLPATILAIDRVAARLREAPERVEGLLALGFDARQVMRFIAPEAAATALTAQIERTKVVGLIALPGAMTGLLLAGVDPVDAVMVQLVVMYLILGAVTLSVSVVTAAAVSASFADGLRLPEWSRVPDDGALTGRRRRRLRE